MNYLIVKKFPNGYIDIRAEYKGVSYPAYSFLYYTEKQAISLYRLHTGLKGKRFDTIYHV